MAEIRTILEMIEEIQEMIRDCTGGALPPDYRIGNQTGEEAFYTGIYTPLADVESILHGLLHQD